MIKAKAKYIVILACLLSLGLNAQFILNGSAELEGNGDYLLTPAQRQKVGSIWYEDKISLNESFELNFELYFGTNDRGADGLSFCLQPLSTSVGVSGGGLGVGGVTPSFFAEFDTYQNGGDPYFDHLAIQKNGDVRNDRSNNLASPVQIVAGQNNVENGQWYPMRVTWDADLKEFKVFVNCALRVSYSGDIVNQIFKGDPNVYWGFASATGGAVNEHRVRNIRSTLLKLEDKTICKNQSTLVNIPPTTSSFYWAPTSGISDLNSLNPTFSPSQTTQYIITYQGFCNTEFRDTFLVEVAEVVNDVGRDTTVCFDDGSFTILPKTNGDQFSWSTTATTKNLVVNSAGTYVLDVVKLGCAARDQITITELCLPKIDTLYMCKSDTVLITKDDAVLGEWSSNSEFVPVSDVSISVSPSDTALYFFSSFKKVKNMLVNGDFEAPYRNSFGIISANTVPGWQTTATDNKMEFWNNGFLGTPSFKGDQFVELNANMPSALYQDVATAPGDKLMWGFAHRGRGGVESMRFEVGPPGGPYQNIKTVSTGKAWVEYAGIYTVPPGQFTTRFYFTSAMPGASGNLLDAIEFYTLSETTDTTVVIVNELPLVELGSDTTICAGDTIVKGKNLPLLNYNWNTGSVNSMINISSAGTYVVEVRNNDGCSFFDSISVNVAEIPAINLGEDTLICKGDTIQLSSGASGRYDWSTNETTPNILVHAEGVYSVNITNDLGCQESDSIKITHQQLPIVDLGNDITICIGQSVSLSVNSNGLRYIWNTAASTETILVNEPGVYNVVVYDDIDCFSTDTIAIYMQDLPNVDLGDNQIICEGEALVLDAQNVGLTYNWNTNQNSKTIVVDQPGVYGVEVTDDIGCVGSDSMELTVNTLPKVNLGNDTSICFGESVTFSAMNPGYNYLWSTGATSREVTLSKTGLYAVVAYDDIGCADTNSVILIVNMLPVVDLGNDTVICDYQSIHLNAQNDGLSFLWNDGFTGQSRLVETEGLYSLEVRDEIGCLGEDDIYVTKEILPDPFYDKNITVCEGQTVTLAPDGGYGDYAVFWLKDTTSPFLNVTETDSYYSVIKSEFCLDTFQIEVEKIDTPDVLIINPGGQDFYCFDVESTTLEISSDDPDVSFNWRGFGRASEVEIINEGEYFVTASNAKCTSRFSYEVEEYCEGSLFIPNAFTPNNDGVNDIFLPINNGHVSNYELWIYNRWGQLVFHTNEQGEGWDGNIEGRAANMDVYVYKLRYENADENGGFKMEEHTGRVTLVR